MTLTGPDLRILQVHPTRFCNLRCLHCYSSSGPEERDALPLPLLVDAIRDAASLGYNVLSISGGEPLLYEGLTELCEEGRKQQMIVSLVSNGTAFNKSRVAKLAGVVDAIAISLDGAPERHNRVRRNPVAFEVMVKRLDLLRRASIPFGFVFTLTRDNLAEIEWAADFAVAQGATLLQIHPVEGHGRAVFDESMQSLSDQELAFGCLVADCLRGIHKGKLSIQFDALSRRRLPAQPEEVMNWHASFDGGYRQVSELVSPLVIEDDGGVVPLRYGFPRPFAFGNLHKSRLADMTESWHQARSWAFCDLYRRVLERVQHSANRFANIYQLLAEAAEPSAALVSIA